MNALHNSFSDFQILGVPCNQFGKQEPAGNGRELENGIRHVRPGNGFNVDFILLKKADVNGVKEMPLFTYLKEYCPPTREEFADPSQLFYYPFKGNDVRWNWEKFLITKSGKPYMRYDSDTKPDAIKNDVAFLLQQEF